MNGNIRTFLRTARTLFGRCFIALLFSLVLIQLLDDLLDMGIDLLIGHDLFHALTVRGCA